MVWIQADLLLILCPTLPSVCWEQRNHFHREEALHGQLILQWSQKVYSPVSWRLQDSHVSVNTAESTSSMTLITILMWTLACCCFTGSFTQQHFQHDVLPFLCFLSADKWRICFCVQDAALRWLWLSLQQWHLLQDPLSLSPVMSTRLFTDTVMEMMLCSGINRNLDSLQSSS